MDFKGSLRGIKKLIGVGSPSPKHCDTSDAPDAPDGQNTIRGCSSSSISACPLTPDCNSSQDTEFDSNYYTPSPKEKRANRFTSSMRNRMMGRKPGKADSFFDKQDSVHAEECYEDVVRRSSPISILNPLEINLPMTRGKIDSKSLEELIAPGGYPPSLLSSAEENCLEPSCPVIELDENNPPPLPARPCIQQLTSFSMDDMFQDSVPVLNGVPPAIQEITIEPVNQPECHTPSKGPNTGHFDDSTYGFHSNEQADADVTVKKSTRTPSEELRHLRGVVRSVSQTMLAALNNDVALNNDATTQTTAFMEPIECPTTRKWLKLSLNEAISMIHDVRLYESYIDKYGVDVFAKAIKNGFLTPSDHPDFLAKHFQASRSFTTTASMADTASIFTFGYQLERCPRPASPDSDVNVDGNKWLARVRIDLEDSELSGDEADVKLMASLDEDPESEAKAMACSLHEDSDSVGDVVDDYAKASLGEDVSLGEATTV